MGQSYWDCRFRVIQYSRLSTTTLGRVWHGQASKVCRDKASDLCASAAGEFKGFRVQGSYGGFKVYRV